eukprot:Rmarinus@m.10031
MLQVARWSIDTPSRQVFLYKFILYARERAASDAATKQPGVDRLDASAVPSYSRPVSCSLQHFKQPRVKHTLHDGIGIDRESIVSPIGAPLMHVSAEKQTTGEAMYCDDIPSPPGCLYAALVVSDRAHANILNIRVEKAEAAQGVERVITYKDVPGSNWIGPIFFDEEAFASKRVTSCGQVIAVVVAVDKRHADAAAKLVEIEYDELPAVLSIDDAIAHSQFYPCGLKEKASEKECRYADAGSVLKKNCDSDAEQRKETFVHELCRGNPDEALQASSHVVEGVVRMSAQEHFYLETQSVLCIPEEGNEMTVWSSTQALAKAQKLMGITLGLPMNQFVVKLKRIGGGFGGKETRACIYSTVVALAAKLCDRPVRIMLDRDMDMATSGMRHPFQAAYKAGIDESGRIRAMVVDVYNNAGYSMDLSLPVLDRALFHIENSYYIPNVRVKGRLCVTNILSNTAFRGFGGPQGMAICEQIMDHLARRLGMSAHRIREINLYEEGQRTHYGQIVENCNLRRMWSELLVTSEFDERSSQIQMFNRENRWKKRGIAMIPTKYGIAFTAKFMNQAASLVHVFQDGSVGLSHGGIEMGQGLNTKMAQICASEFGIPMDKVHITETATDKCANTQPTAASSGSDLNGMAVIDACRQIKERLRPLADEMPTSTFAEIVGRAHMERINLSATGFYKTPDIHFDWEAKSGRPFNYFTCGVAVAEVEIDVLTGDHTVLRADILMDLGTPINPAIDIGQIEGAFVQGQGMYTIEEVVFGDKAHPWVRPGSLFTRGPSTYKIPGFQDVPIDFRVSLLSDAHNPRAVHSTKAVGEPPLFLASSIFFAIKEAIYAARTDSGLNEYFVLDQPATSERIRMSCGDSFAQTFASTDFRPPGSV